MQIVAKVDVIYPMWNGAQYFDFTLTTNAEKA